MHMAVVRDPEGGTLGIITMSDVLDTLFHNLSPNGKTSRKEEEEGEGVDREPPTRPN